MADRPRREGFLRVRMGGDEGARWTAAAEAAGHPSLSNWVRALADEAAATGGDGRAVAAALVALRADLAQGVGNNLNQLARHANEGHGVDSQAIAAASREVEAARRAVSRAIAAIRPDGTGCPAVIITGSRIATSSGARAVGSHVLSGPANESIAVLQGCQADLDDMVRDAEAGGSKYALRHWKVSPKEGMTGVDLMRAARNLAREFGADPARLVVVEHKKRRAGGLGFERHGHVIAPEYDPVAGRVLDAHWMRPRHEKLARMAEERLGHALVPGRWNAAVGRALAEEGMPGLARRLDVAAALPRPESAFTADAHQAAARRGRSLPAGRLAVAQAWERSDSAGAFAAACREQGIGIRAGDKPGTFIAERDGALIGAVHRLTGARKGEVAKRLDGMDLPPVADARAAPVPGGQEAAPGPLDGDRAPQAPDPGQPAAVPAPEAPAPLAAPAATAATAAVPSRDGTQAASAHMAMPAGKGGGGGSAPEAGGGDAGGGALAMESIDGPGEPPGPGASIAEVQRWRERFIAYEERKGRAWLAQRAAIAAENERRNRKGATIHAHAQPQAAANTAPGASPILAALGRARRIRPGLSAQAGHSGHGHAHPGGGEGGPGHGAARRGHPGGDAAAGGGGGRPPGRGSGVAGSDMHEARDDGRQALRHRAALARAASALGSIDTGPLLDMLEPARAAARLLGAEEGRIARLRAQEPYPDPLDRDPDGCARAARAALWRPLHAAREALPAAMERARAAEAAWRWWRPDTWGVAREAAAALAHAHAAVAAATPSGDALDDAAHAARIRAEAARDAHRAWHATVGQRLDRAGQMLHGIRAALDGGDLAMRRAVLGEGVAAAVRLHASTQAGRVAAHGHGAGAVVVGFPGPR